MSNPLWSPSADAIAKTHMHRFMKQISNTFSIPLNNYFELHQWSTENLASFWQSVWDYGEILANTKAKHVFIPATSMQKCQWFEGATLNFAMNCLKRRDNHAALYYANETGERRQLSYAELYAAVCDLAAKLDEQGLQPQDRVAACLPNCPEAIITMLATTSLGGVFSSCSPDFGLQGLIDRFGQIEPKFLFAIDKHYYQGKVFEHLDTIQTLQTHLPSLLHTFIIPYKSIPLNLKLQTKTSVLKFENRSAPKNFGIPLPFDHPLYILYSSGTTGKPKCMVHGAGRTLIQHQKELMLHTDMHPHDNIFFFTTCGWMMWNWMVSSLTVGATITLYEGSPFYPNRACFFDLIDEFKVTVLGVGAKFLEASAKFRSSPIHTHSLKSLRTVLTTGSPLLPNSFDYVYHRVKKEVCLSSISGGSDIISCFALGNPLLPVYRGELQCIGLGMDVKIFNSAGKSVVDEKGELVCVKPFPSMPLYFWNDPDGKKYQQSYFENFPNVWTHGDYAKITPKGGMIIYGRSDATLNPSGIRVGTAEIYQQLEKMDAILEGLAVGQQWKGCERIILFVVLREGELLTEELARNIKQTIKQNASPHHVPAKILQVPELPRTISGKIVEIAVKKIIHHEAINNIEALANPHTLEYFKDLAELKK